MEVAKLIIPAALFLAVSSSFFGVVVARVMWADEATRADRTKAHYEKLRDEYENIFETNVRTIATQKELIEKLKRR